MKNKLLKIILTAALFVCSVVFSCPAWADTDVGYYQTDKVKLSAECAVLMEASSRRVLFASNSAAPRAMASTTKIMTALVIIENCALNDVVTIPREAQGVEGSSIYLMAGEKLTVKELLYGLMLRSGNDAATALAIHCSGSISKFAELMNKTAKELGALNSSFTNPSGLPDQYHYTTAYDLALIAARAMEYDVFREIVSTVKTTIPWGGHDTDRLLINKNKMLAQYEGADGIKTGYTIAAGRCLVASATRNGMTLIAVVLNCSPMYADCASILDFGFQNYKMTEVFKPETVMGSIDVEHGFTPSVTYKTLSGFSFPAAQNDTVSVTVRIYSQTAQAPVSKGDVIGFADVYVNGTNAASVPLVLCHSSNRNTLFSRFSSLIRYGFSGS